MHLIGLDIGTTGCKALVFDPEGRIKGSGFAEYDVVCTEPAMGEQDAERVWALARQVLRQAVAQSGTQDIAALSASVQGDAIIPVDAEGRALHAAILGMDYRSQKQARECEEQFGGFELFQRTGMRPHPINSLTKVLMLREKRPEIFAKTRRVMTYADFILCKLGAEPTIDWTMASRTMAFDLQRRAWCDDLLAQLGLETRLWSKAVASGTPVGTIRRGLAEELGLPTGLTLVAGGHDQSCAAVGAGVIKEKRGVVSTGTAEVLSTAFNAPALTRQMYDGFYPCYLHARGGMYFTFSLNHVGGMLLKWFRDHFCGPELAEAKGKGHEAYRLLDERMPRQPTRLFVLPHLNGTGTPWCDLQATGAILGLTLATTRHEIARAILEGLCFELLINLETLCRAGIEVSEIVAAGGGAKSSLWLQMKADILRRPIRTLGCRESACLGAALLAGTGVGVYRSLEEAVQQTVVVDREFVPQTDTARFYKDRFEVYRELYPVLRSLQNPIR